MIENRSKEPGQQDNYIRSSVDSRVKAIRQKESGHGLWRA
jgi:hypothetical protein